jgi:hypothetical protein
MNHEKFITIERTVLILTILMMTLGVPVYIELLMLVVKLVIIVLKRRMMKK